MEVSNFLILKMFTNAKPIRTASSETRLALLRRLWSHFSMRRRWQLVMLLAMIIVSSLADPDLPGNLPLVEFRIFLKNFQQLILNLFHGISNWCGDAAPAKVSLLKFPEFLSSDKFVARSLFERGLYKAAFVVSIGKTSSYLNPSDFAETPTFEKMESRTRQTNFHPRCASALFV
jgi:hypothetical protein